MDPLTIAYYAIVCSCLSAAASRMPRLIVRLAIGAVVGVIAATALPEVKGLLGETALAMGYLR